MNPKNKKRNKLTVEQRNSKNIRKQIQQNDSSQKNKEIEFACSNCLTIFMFKFNDVVFNKVRELHFTPEAECPYCGSTVDIAFTDFGQERIEDMIFSNQIRTMK